MSLLLLPTSGQWRVGVLVPSCRDIQCRALPLVSNIPAIGVPSSARHDLCSDIDVHKLFAEVQSRSSCRCRMIHHIRCSYLGRSMSKYRMRSQLVSVSSSSVHEKGRCPKLSFMWWVIIIKVVRSSARGKETKRKNECAELEASATDAGPSVRKKWGIIQKASLCRRGKKRKVVE